MKPCITIVVAPIVIFLVSCSHDSPAFFNGYSETGVVQVTVNLGKIGKLGKKMKKTEIEMAQLHTMLSAAGETTIRDTCILDGGYYERTGRMTFPQLTARASGIYVEWTLSVQTIDRSGRIIHSGDTIFTIPIRDTAKITMFCDAHYSMLVANYFPIRDSVTRCELVVDNRVMADYAFPKQMFIGDTVTLSFDYLTTIDTHYIGLNVYGDNEGDEMVLYSGKTTLIPVAGEDREYKIGLKYVGPSRNGADVPEGAAMTAMLRYTE